MIHKNLTPFYWGPKVTSRIDRQVEMTLCVRAVYRLAPGIPLEAIEDPIEQGFMTGDVFAEEDINQEGALLYASDFADYKLNAEVLLKGSCHPPGGAATECEVRFGVGGWQKSLRVIGPRVYRPGVLMGGSASEPEPFKCMPLTWENAYGGGNHAGNPVGRGHEDPELPTVETIDNPIRKPGARGAVAGSFGAISPQWTHRLGKRGKKYDASWKRKRAPFYAEDFDWTYFNAAPADQQLEGYLQGDEVISFDNLHPNAESWSATLPGLRIRAMVKKVDGKFDEPIMRLDTLYADLEDGKLYLTWRGLSPVNEIDMTDVGVVLIASEPLADEPKSSEHYIALLEEFEADPIGLEDGFPPGFMEVAAAVEAAELAELNGEPLPDLKAIAANLPPGCPFPPWFLAAVAGDEDPLGVMAAFPGDEDDPLGLAAKAGGLADPEALSTALADLSEIKDDPTQAVEALSGVVDLLPGDAKALFQQNLAGLEQAFANAKGAVGEELFGNAIAAASDSPPGAAASEYAGMLEQTKDSLAQAKTLAESAETPDANTIAAIAKAEANLDQAPPSLDDAVAQALKPLDDVEMPPLPDIPDVEADIAIKRAEIEAQEAKLRQAHGDHPMLGLFAMGHKLLDNAPRPEDLAPDMSPMVEQMVRAQDALLAQGISLAALAPLSGLIEKVKAVVAQLPKRPALPEGEFVKQDLRGHDFSNRDLKRAVFVEADLTGALFVGADLEGANFRDADLTKADLSRANLRAAEFTGCTLQKAVLTGAKAQGAIFNDAELGEADLTGADLERAEWNQAKAVKCKLSGARLVGADLRFADLSKADLRDADLTEADLSFVVMSLVKGDRTNFTATKLDMAKIQKSRLHEAVFHNATSNMGSFEGSDLSGADLRSCQFVKVDLMGAILDRANFNGAKLAQLTLRDVQAVDTSFRAADLGGSSATGKSNFEGARFTHAKGFRSVWMDAILTRADFSHSDFEQAYFQGATGEDVDFSSARLKGASFRKSRWTRVGFEHSDLCGADFTGSSLDDADFKHANCYNAKFAQARAVRCDFKDANLDAVQFDADQQAAGESGA